MYTGSSVPVADGRTALSPAPVSPEPGGAGVRRARAPRGAVRIAGVSPAHSPETFSQQQVLERLGLIGDEFAQRIYARSGVHRRHLNLDEEFLHSTLSQRAEWIERNLLEHAIRAVDALAIDPLEVGTIVSASLYSLGCPSLAHRLIEHYGMSPATDKYHLTGVGCASGVPLMRLAAQSLREQPGKTALVVAAECMSGVLGPTSPQDPRAKIVGSAIFGDGCAAALLRHDTDTDTETDIGTAAGIGLDDAPGIAVDSAAGIAVDAGLDGAGIAADTAAGLDGALAGGVTAGRGPAILASRVHQVPDTLDAVSLRVGGEDAYLHLARELPYIAGDALGEVVDGFLAEHALSRAQIAHWVVHPGGRRIIENIQSALSLSTHDTALSWDALADHGNIGTPSILYVLADTIARRAPAPGEHGLLVTIGPGVTVGLMLLGW